MDPTRLVAGVSTDFATLWRVDPSIGRNLAILAGHTDWVFFCNWSPDGSILATASADGTARLWKVPLDSAGISYVELTGHFGWVMAAAYSPDGRWVVTAGLLDMTVRIYDSSDLDAEPVIVQLKSSPSGIAWHPTGVEFTTVEVSGIVTFWSAPDGTQKPSQVRP